MRQANIPPDSEHRDFPFLDITDVPELDDTFPALDDLLRDMADCPTLEELMAGLPSLDDLLVDVANLPTVDDLVADAATANDQSMLNEIVRQAQRDIDALLGPEERTVSKLLGAYTLKKPARRCHRRRKANS